jgi:hypothetical protein
MRAASSMLPAAAVRQVAIYLRDDALWVADFVDGKGEIIDATTWFRFNCASAAPSSMRQRMLLESAIPLSLELAERVERLHGYTPRRPRERKGPENVERGIITCRMDRSHMHAAVLRTGSKGGERVDHRLHAAPLFEPFLASEVQAANLPPSSPMRRAAHSVNSVATPRNEPQRRAGVVPVLRCQRGNQSC